MPLATLWLFQSLAGIESQTLSWQKLLPVFSSFAHHIFIFSVFCQIFRIIDAFNTYVSSQGNIEQFQKPCQSAQTSSEKQIPPLPAGAHYDLGFFSHFSGGDGGAGIIRDIPVTLPPINPGLEMRWKRVKIDWRKKNINRSGQQIFKKPSCRVMWRIQNAGMRRGKTGIAAIAWSYLIIAQIYMADISARLGGGTGIPPGQSIRNAPWPGAAVPNQYFTHSTNSPTKGLVLRSLPMVVCGPWPG